jgi:hypothetical protein
MGFHNNKIKKRKIMFNEFDDLFDKYFNNNDDPFKRMRNLVNRLNDFESIDDNGGNPHERELGEPDEVTEFNENGYTFRRSVWDTEGGSIVKVEMVSSPLDIGFTAKRDKNGLSLDAKLKIAIENEDYEKAAELRDKINGKKKSKN